MNPADTIQAAIDKLSRQRDASQRIVSGRWANDDDPEEVTGSHGAVSESWSREHADLIVTLHATIDAQLAVLHLALDYGELESGSGSRFIKAANELARAILGENVK